MVSIYDLKPRFQNLLRPLTRRLVRCGVTANHVTLFAMLLSLAVGGWIAWDPEQTLPLLLVPLVLFVRMALNAVDGMIAREHDMTSDLGTFLNELGDVVSDAGLYLPLALVPGVLPGPVVAAVVLAVIAEMTGIIAVQIGTERRYDGPMGKSDRAFAFGALYLALGCELEAGDWFTGVMAVINLLLVVTILNRVRKALQAKSATNSDSEENSA